MKIRTPTRAGTAGSHIGYTAFDTTIGGEAEFVEIVLCRRCEISLRKSKETEAGIEKYKAF
jgi:hypothetical protein